MPRSCGCPIPGASNCSHSPCTWRRRGCSHPSVRCSSARSRSGVRASSASSDAGEPIVVDVADGARARRVARAPRAIPREGLDRRDRPDRHDRPSARLADSALDATRPPGRRVHDRVRRRDRRAGRARDRQRAPLPAAEGLLGRHATLAAAAGSAGSRGPRCGRDVRRVGTRRGRWRPLRLPDARRTDGLRSFWAT